MGRTLPQELFVGGGGAAEVCSILTKGQSALEFQCWLLIERGLESVGVDRKNKRVQEERSAQVFKILMEGCALEVQCLGLI